MFKKKIITNMDNVSLLVNHNVSIVSILYLEKEPKDRVRRHRGDKVSPSVLESSAGLVPVLLLEVVKKVGVGSSTKLVSRFGVRNTF